MIEEGEVRIAESMEGRELNHRFGFAFKEHRQNDDVVRRRFAESGTNVDIVRGNVGHEDAFLLERALAHQTFAGMKFIGETLTLVIGIAAQ